MQRTFVAGYVAGQGVARMSRHSVKGAAHIAECFYIQPRALVVYSYARRQRRGHWGDGSKANE